MPSSNRHPRANFPGQDATTSWPAVRSCARPSRGFTLLEVLLVIAVMVVIASLATPNLLGMLETHKLRKSGDMLRAEFARARIRAMKSGRIQMFRYQTEQSGFLVQPWIMADDDLEASESQQDTGRILQPTQEDIVADDQPTQMPDGIKFLGSETQEDSRTAAIYESIESDLASDQVWSPPILFYPDGTSSSASVVLANNRNQVIQVTLRGLTGMSESSDLKRPEELSP